MLDRLLEARAHADLTVTHSSNTAVVDAKIRLENLRFETLASSHPSVFTEVRDELANLMLDLPEPERWSWRTRSCKRYLTYRCEHFLGTE